jgi:hypothetical protein
VSVHSLVINFDMTRGVNESAHARYLDAGLLLVTNRTDFDGVWLHV